MIPGYQIIEEIGKGGMANVYKARSIDGKIVAIKMLNDFYKNDLNVRKRFQNEALAMQKLNHPNIVKVEEFVSIDDNSAIIMEYLDGITLSQFVKRYGPLNEKIVLSIMNQILSALDFAHKNGIIHRDIKPSNFIIQKNNIIKIIDFGIAKFVDSDKEFSFTKTGTAIGTVAYMSPEQVKGLKNIDNLTDIYSLGVLLYYMLEGKHPYNLNELSDFDVRESIVKKPLPSLNNKFNFVIKKATEKKPKDRYLSCQQFMEDLLKASQTTGVTKTEIDLNENKIVKLLAGRSYEADIKINKPYVSRKHAFLIIDIFNNKYFIQDLNSTSGTYVNNKKVINKQQLDKGDVVRFGDYIFDWEHYVSKVVRDNTIENEEIYLQSGTTYPNKKNETWWDNYVKAMSKFYIFEGRANKKEYWSFVFFSLLIFFLGNILLFLMSILFEFDKNLTFITLAGYSGLVFLIHLVPGLAVGVRRIHDTNNSGWFVLVPFYNLVLSLTDGNSFNNKYGYNK